MSDELREAVRQWVAKAESDWATVQILTDHSNAPADSVCFHCQQYVEKLLKALLTYYGIEAPRTHDLKRLAQLAVPRLDELATFGDDIDKLTAHAVQSRYPDQWRPIDQTEVAAMVELATRVGDTIRTHLRL